MCIFSTCGQMLYGILMFACLVLTAVATFTSSWADVKDLRNSNFGIMPWTCITTGGTGGKCSAWWDGSSNWRRAVAVMMCIAMALQILALAWNLFTCFACCCKKWLIHPLSIFALLILAFLLASVITFAANYKHDFKPLTPELSWSFYLAVAALCVAAIDVLVGAVTVFLGRHHL